MDTASGHKLLNGAGVFRLGGKITVINKIRPSQESSFCWLIVNAHSWKSDFNNSVWTERGILGVLFSTPACSPSRKNVHVLRSGPCDCFFTHIDQSFLCMRVQNALLKKPESVFLRKSEVEWVLAGSLRDRDKAVWTLFAETGQTKKLIWLFTSS